jgi:hypothetical protein
MPSTTVHRLLLWVSLEALIVGTSVSENFLCRKLRSEIKVYQKGSFLEHKPLCQEKQMPHQGILRTLEGPGGQSSGSLAVEATGITFLGAFLLLTRSRQPRPARERIRA